MKPVWSEPYLETCCRAALHRLYLCGQGGRPSGAQDEPCLRRLMDMAFCDQASDGRLRLTQAGRRRHTTEVLKGAVAPEEAISSQQTRRRVAG
jgi:hypothetical protein